MIILIRWFLLNATLFQDAYGDTIEKGYAPITSIEKINPGYGKTYYKLSIDGGYNRDARVDGALYGSFTVHPKTKVIGEVSVGTTSLDVDSTVGFGTTGSAMTGVDCESTSWTKPAQHARNFVYFRL